MLQVKWYESIDSTNSEALRQISSDPEITVFAAHYQTHGRGQKGNHWESAKGANLTFSLLVKPIFIPATRQFVISQTVTLALLDYLNSKNIVAKIKWPNDIYVGNKKICGILIENHFSDANLSASIIGIGLNLNQIKFDTDAPNPTSMRLITGEEYNLAEELSCFCSYFESRYNKLKNCNLDSYIPEIDSEYKSNMFQFGVAAKYENIATGEQFSGIIRGVSDNACLEVETEDRSIKRFAFKEIKYIIDYN